MSDLVNDRSRERAPPARSAEIRIRVRRFLDRIIEATPPLRALRAARRMRRRMRLALGYEPDLRHPRTFNEKIAWRILHDRNPLITRTSDKIAVRDWVAARAGSDILIPLLGVWNHAEAIDWDSLPRSFVLKASHGWNMNLLVYDKDAIDRDAVTAMAATWLRTSHYTVTGEWGYRDIPRRLLAETMLLDDAGKIPPDLKFHVFRGRVELIGVHTGRFAAHRVTFLDRTMRHLPVIQGCPADPDWTPPHGMHALIPIAERLGAWFDYVRVDLYLVAGQARFGELTHYDSGACSAYTPEKYDRMLGDLWQMPDNRRWLRRR